MTAGDYELVFEEPPPPLRQPHGAQVRKSERHLRPVRDYIAPESHRSHGSYVKYVVERCACPACRQANRDYEKRRQHAISRPDEVWIPYVPAGPARRHLAELAAAGVGLKQVGRVSGVSHGALTKIVYGDRQRGRAPSRRIRQATADKIRAVTAADVAAGAKVDGSRTWALIEELVAAGYTKQWIAGQLGVLASNLAHRPQYRASTVAKVAEIHRRHINEPPPKRKSRWDNR